LLYNAATLVPKRQAHILEAERDCRFPIAIVSIRKDGVVACSTYPIDPIAWTGTEPVTISELSRYLGMPLKSVAPEQPPGGNNPYRSR
jgi:hypothetical protein